jgi:hypothetical protein
VRIVIFNKTFEDFLAIENKGYRKKRAKDNFDRIKLETLNMML